ncbi:hypothetical protein [Bradyrhizobium elkanii]|uniref:hypothetical protein n=1 Tax=Bradyrhizobium elkanii TaxID=29448 RepID=UPI0035198EAD
MVDALPEMIRVAGFDIRIERWTNHQAAGVSRWGEFSSIEQTIRIQNDMPSRFKAVDTVLHEISHAIYWAYGIEDDDKQERIVSVFGTAWMTLHRDNSWLADWIKNALAGS